jgi:RimJ/RimL family protein N-acetyltransferase
LNADPRVREFYPTVATRDESAKSIDYARSHFARHGFGMWAVEVIDGPPFIGFIGLGVPEFHANFTPCVEIGWRLAVEHWGRGYATEGARAAAAFGFDVKGLQEIVAFTVPANMRSRRVMEKIGMTHDARDDFDMPTIEEGHPLRRHVLYRLRADGLQHRAL